ncbi:hypothetical protein E1B28_009597 [Marasmius oreades]|uniref:Protein kinase domain-containing protein n=1 Tax=Marasmius oreades TaxID=181124 RepID=A0A9P7UQM2_9AGAR|nr:uncharacterized protein E1B28_009597 [Marasmius oreades]KAG7090483.1 hypothetical protein E1B28_009597 [Marasmius oreades]
MAQPAEPEVTVYYVATKGFPTKKNILDLEILGGTFKISREDGMKDLEQRFLDSKRCPIPGGTISSIFKPLHSLDVEPVHLQEALERSTRLTDFAKPLPLRRSVRDAETLQVQDDTTEVSFTVILFVIPPDKPNVRPATPQEDAEELDIVAELDRDTQRFIKLIRDGPTPSASAKSINYHSIQATDGQALVDGRFSGKKYIPTTGLPIELMHPTFSRFLHNAAKSDPPEDIVRMTAELMRTCSQIQVRESPRDKQSSEVLGKILHFPLEKVNSGDGSTPDFSILEPSFESISALPGCGEIKPELGHGGDPTVQGGFSYARFICQEKHEPLLNISCCPTYMVALAGPWLCVVGAVTTSRTIVQRLTPYEWLAVSRAMDDAQVLRVARILYALRVAIHEDLRNYYKDLKPPTVLEGHVHPRHCPFISSFELVEDEQQARPVEFDYVKPLERGHTCAAFLVRRRDVNELAVVKFVRRYGADAHRLMADEGLAPALIHYGPLGDPHAPDLHIVVMEHVVGRTLYDLYGDGDLPGGVKSAIQDALKKLNHGGFIFPDLRRPNVMVTTGGDDGNVEGYLRFVDFDWVCQKDEGMRYPCHLSEELRRCSGAKDYDVITLQHQERMFREL